MSTAAPNTYLKLLLSVLFWGGTWVAGRVAVREIPTPPTDFNSFSTARRLGLAPILAQ